MNVQKKIFFILLVISVSCLPSKYSFGNESEENIAAKQIAEHLLQESKLHQKILIVYEKNRIEGKPSTPSQLWKKENKNLTKATLKDFKEALGEDKNKWPNLIYFFTFESLEKNKLTVDLRVLYNTGKTKDSRGGYATKLYFKKIKNTWKIEKENNYNNWD